jgi:hypothetical protein
MDESERLSTALALQHHFADHSTGSDLLLSCMIAAATSYRRHSGETSRLRDAAAAAAADGGAAAHPTPPRLRYLCACRAVCAPFPKELYPPDHHGDKDLAALRADLAALPPATRLQQLDTLTALPDRQLQLLRWLLLRETRRRLLHALPAPQLQRLLRGRALGWERLFACDWMRASAVFRLEQGGEQQLHDPVIAFHGTSFENLYSILQNGLLNLTGTLMQVGRWGAALHGRHCSGLRRPELVGSNQTCLQGRAPNPQPAGCMPLLAGGQAQRAPPPFASGGSSAAPPRACGRRARLRRPPEARRQSKLSRGPTAPLAAPPAAHRCQLRGRHLHEHQLGGGLLLQPARGGLGAQRARQ